MDIKAVSLAAAAINDVYYELICQPVIGHQTAINQPASMNVSKQTCQMTKLAQTSPDISHGDATRVAQRYIQC